MTREQTCAREFSCVAKWSGKGSSDSRLNSIAGLFSFQPQEEEKYFIKATIHKLMANIDDEEN